jgi:pSer/pThr/pTyr-binding forkhead associated (FHA) protein
LYGLIGLLALGAIVITALLVTRPKTAAVVQQSGGTRAAAASAGTATTPAATVAASESSSTQPVEAPPAKLTMPDGSELLLAGNNRSFGRQDFDKFLAPDKRSFISRQHVNIWYENDRYYIEDRSSTNGTSLNGSDIKGNGRHALENGDVIELAGKLSITFKT